MSIRRKLNKTLVIYFSHHKIILLFKRMISNYCFADQITASLYFLELLRRRDA
jgi:hypothetical protein